MSVDDNKWIIVKILFFKYKNLLKKIFLIKKNL